MFQSKSKAAAEARRTSFLNVDLDVYSRTALTPLAVAFGDRVLALHVGRHANHFRGHFELHAPPRTGVNTLIAGLVRLVRELPPSARSVWKRAYRRDLNIGIQAGSAPPFYELFLEADTLMCIRPGRRRRGLVPTRRTS